MKPDWSRRLLAILALAIGLTLSIAPLGAASGPDGRIAVLPRDAQASVAAIVAGAADAQFRPLAGPTYQPAFDQREVWLRVELPPAQTVERRFDAEPNDPLVLTVGRLAIESLSLFRRGADSDLPVWHDAFFAPPNAAEFFATAFAYRIPPEAAPGTVYYLHTEDRDPTQIRIELRSQREFVASDRNFTLLLVFVFTTLGVMAVTNLVFYLALGDRAYLYYVAYVATLMLFISVVQGLPYQVAALRWIGAWTSHVPAVLASLSGLSGVAFCRLFVDSPRVAPRVDKVLQAFGVAFALTAALSALAWAPSITVLRQSGNLLLLGLSVTQFLLGSIGWLRGSRSARFFLIAWFGPIVGSALRSLGAFGLVPLSPTIVNAFLIGQAAQALILSIGLADRTLQMRRQRDHAQGLREQAESKLRLEQRRSTELEQRASIDALTGVFNRRRIESELNQAIAYAQSSATPLAVLFFDVDHFKQVNDNHGHIVGDLCLALVARRIREALAPDQICGRYGGEEFLVVLPGVTESEAQSLAEQVRTHVGAEPVPAGEARIAITVSVGGAAHDPGADQVASLLERADQALYRAKGMGRNRLAWAVAPD